MNRADANVNARGNDGRSPLDAILDPKFVSIIKLLKVNGAEYENQS